MQVCCTDSLALLLRRQRSCNNEAVILRARILRLDFFFEAPLAKADLLAMATSCSGAGPLSSHVLLKSSHGIMAAPLYNIRVYPKP